MKKSTTMKFNDDELDNAIQLFQWALSDYPDKETDEYKEYVKVAKRFEKAKARMNGEKYNKNDSWFD